MNAPRFVLCFTVAALGAGTAKAKTWEPSAGHVQLPLWPATDGPSTAAAESEVTVGKTLVAGKRWLQVANVTRPTITIYPPTGENTGTAIVVFPGGGYHVLAIDLEGTEVCTWLTSKGITCVLLKYRVPRSGPHWDDVCRCHVQPKTPTALQDAQRALGLLRLHAAEWHINPQRIGVLGFSAGGHLAAAASTHTQRVYPAMDAADRQSCRPDFAVVLYPGHLWTGHALELAADIHATRKTPPTFLLHAENDPVDDVRHSLAYYLALRQAGAPVEMHLYAHGGHAFGLRPTSLPIAKWPVLVEQWLGTLGMLPR